MKKIVITIIVVTLLISPWVVVNKIKHQTGLSLYCEVPFTINSQKSDTMLINGLIKTHYYPNGSGIGILSSNMHFQQRGNNNKISYTAHRNTRFTYEQSHSYITTHTQEMHPAYGESIPEPLANEYIFPSFKKGFNDYYQVEKMANGDMMVSVANMPRLYCHTN